MEQEKLKKIIEFAKSFHEGDRLHDWEHIKNVVSNLKLILQKEEGDSKALIVAAYLHDIGYKDNGKKDHNLVSAKRAEPFLKELNFEDDFIKRVLKYIVHHRLSYAKKSNDKNCQIICDADKLDQIGCQGLIRVIEKNTIKGLNLKESLNKAVKKQEEIHLFTKTANEIKNSEKEIVRKFIKKVKERLN